MPEERDFKFTAWEKTISPPFTAYADIECYLEKTDTAPDKIQKHVPAAIGYIIIPHSEMLYKPPFVA